MKKHLILSLLPLLVAGACQAQSVSWLAPEGPSQSDFGGAGLLQLPTARMAQEGEFSLNYRYNDQYHFYSASVQLFSWLETTLRYTDVKTRRYSDSESFSGDQSYKDKAFDLKLRLWQESWWLPQVSLGMRDIGGTGLFDSEYLVASKAWGPFDFTVGLGWGYLGTSGNISNPFNAVSDKFNTRPRRYGSPGAVSFDNMFRGPASVFAGIEYQTPWQPLRLKVEYEGNNYREDFAGRLKQDSNINVGAVYSLTDWARINLSYQRRNTLMAGVTLHTNFNQLRYHGRDTPKPPYRPQPPQSGTIDAEQASQQLTDLQILAGFYAPKIEVKGNTLYASGEQVRYRDNQEGIDRANVILANHLPAGVDTIALTETRTHLPQVTTKTDVASLQRQLEGYPLGQTETLRQQRVEPVAAPPASQRFAVNSQRLNYSLSPVLNQSVGGPESFYMYQLGLMANGSYWLTDNLLVDGSVFANLKNNYSKFRYDGTPHDSTLPRVRTHVRDYLDNNVFMNNLQANYMQHLGNGFYGQLYGGYLEAMFGGVGGELLYRPLDARWAVGVDVARVRQRDWNNMMKFTSYSASVGNITAYWRPWFSEDILVKASVGQYLAKDRGVTFDISKRFDSGITAGVYATKTNVSRKDYGEGGFTKGFYISVPMDLFSSAPVRSRAQINWVPLTRDGGQMLGRKFHLYDMTSDRDRYYR